VEQNGRFHPRFFHQFAAGALVKGFIHVEKAAWKSPGTRKRIPASLDQQNAQTALTQRKNRYVGGKGRVWIGVGECHVVYFLH
jgi:hypothetical protein